MLASAIILIGYGFLQVYSSINNLKLNSNWWFWISLIMFTDIATFIYTNWIK